MPNRIAQNPQDEEEAKDTTFYDKLDATIKKFKDDFRANEN
jgi:hypothetical protein